jgi:hypothetical protein
MPSDRFERWRLLLGVVLCVCFAPAGACAWLTGCFAAVHAWLVAAKLVRWLVACLGGWLVRKCGGFVLWLRFERFMLRDLFSNLPLSRDTAFFHLVLSLFASPVKP